MKYKSAAISLTYIKNGESSIISKILTKEMGLQTFFVKGVRSKKSKKKLSLFEPLKLLHIDASFDKKKPFQYLSDINLASNFNNQSNKMYNHFVSFFIAEVTSKVTQENEQNKMLFNFVWETTNKLYRSKEKDPNFPLIYLIELTKYLGFYPSNTKLKNSFFELEEGCFAEKRAPAKTYLNKQQSMYLKSLLKNDDVLIPKKEKSQLLKELMLYYKLHHYNLDRVTSHTIIEELK